MATQRAHMPIGTNTVLDRRTLERDNKNLLSLVKNGMTVLDVGCGSGSITRDIAEKVGVTGCAVGVDINPGLISQAKTKYKAVPNLSFHPIDILDFETELKFDLITTARTLQWIHDPKNVLRKMKSLLTTDGCITALDYNHRKIEWHPTVPVSMIRFYNSFLNWRQDAAMSNQIADQLAELFFDAGFKRISVTDESEFSFKHDRDFLETAGIWKKVAETRGHQLVNDGYITEQERLSAIDEYDQWLSVDAISMKMYLQSATGFNS